MTDSVSAFGQAAGYNSAMNRRTFLASSAAALASAATPAPAKPVPELASLDSGRIGGDVTVLSAWHSLPRPEKLMVVVFDGKCKTYFYYRHAGDGLYVAVPARATLAGDFTQAAE